MIQPEQMSLAAHSHIQKILKNGTLTEDDLNAVYRLSQHLRVFGLLSAVGYMNQSANESEGKVRARISLVWKPLLAQLLMNKDELLANKDEIIKPKELMEKVIGYANDKPDIYMLQWRRSLELSPHWNFWARAYKQDK
jgi:hypothetical protein